MTSRLLIPMAVYCLIAVSTASLAGDLSPFTTDGCSFFPDGTLMKENAWQGCCIEHDRAYWKGGSFQDRVLADLTLKKCVSDLGEPQVAEIMLQGVRTGGSPYWPTRFRWGYGWPYPRGYRELSVEELRQVKNLEGARGIDER